VAIRLNVRALAAACLLAFAGSATAERPFVPVYEKDFPDPFIVEHGAGFLAYSTNSGGTNLPMIASANLVDWAPVMDPARPGKPLDAMPVLAPWVKEGRTWAPEVLRAGDTWLLYYSAHHRKRDVQCVGVATASDPRGPFRDSGSEPLVCQYELGGTIDAHPFRDADGTLYLYYKSDANNPKVAKQTTIWAQPLSADGRTLTGQPVALLFNDKPWEAHVVEAPTMVRRPDGGYALFFSAHHFGWEADQRLSAYAMGYASCRSPLGPCEDAPENPILHSYNDKAAGCLSGPGHQMLFQTRGRSFLAFHAWAASGGCRSLNKGRYMYIAPLTWQGGKPVLGVSLRKAKAGR
jgi:beta-xylosidase